MKCVDPSFRIRVGYTNTRVYTHFLTPRPGSASPPLPATTTAASPAAVSAVAVATWTLAAAAAVVAAAPRGATPRPAGWRDYSVVLIMVLIIEDGEGLFCLIA